MMIMIVVVILILPRVIIDTVPDTCTIKIIDIIVLHLTHVCVGEGDVRGD